MERAKRGVDRLGTSAVTQHLRNSPFIAANDRLHQPANRCLLWLVELQGFHRQRLHGAVDTALRRFALSIYSPLRAFELTPTASIVRP